MVTRIQAQQVVSQAGRELSARVGPVARRARKTARKTVQQASAAMPQAVSDAVSGALGLGGERMSKVDTAWLRMDSESNLMMIVGVWILKPGIKIDPLRERLSERLLKYRRFTQRTVQSPAGASWIDHTEFEIDRHIVIEKLPKTRKGQEQIALQDRLAELTMQPLDADHPLWQFHLVEDYQGGSAMILRIHHCIADGIALISVVMSLMDGGAPPPERTQAKAKRGGLEGAEDWITDTLIKPLTDVAVRAMDMAGEGAVQSLGLIGDPQKGVSGSMDMAKMAYQVVSDLAALALMPDDSKTRLKGQPGRQKRVAWCQPIPLEEVKAVGKALHCSINDVLLSCVAGAIGEYLKSKGDDVANQQIRAMVPVNLRPMDQAYKLGNRFGLAPLVLPIGIANPIERVYAVHARMSDLKGSYQPLLAFAILSMTGLFVKPVQDAVLGLFAKKTTAVMTNVPGPAVPLKLCGSTMRQSMFWVPASGDVGVGLSILSYGGGVQFGLITDEKLCPDPDDIINRFASEFEKLLLVALMLPWGGPDAP